MSVEINCHTKQGPSPWAKKQLSQFRAIADLIPSGVPVIIRLPVTEAMTGLTNQQLWQMEKDGKFPKRTKLNPDSPPERCGRPFSRRSAALARSAPRFAEGVGVTSWDHITDEGLRVVTADPRDTLRAMTAANVPKIPRKSNVRA